MRAALAVVALASLGAGPAQAQSMRSFSAARQHHGETTLTTTIEFAAGTLRLRPTSEALLYRMVSEYDQERFRPVSRYSVVESRVTLGIESIGDWELRVPSRKHLQQSATVELSPEVDLSLNASFGAVDAELELGGLRLSTVALKTGASKVLIRFSEANATRCREARFTAGAAELKIYGLGNSRCDVIRLEGEVGTVTLDFAGAWTADMRLEATVAAGELTLRLPRTVGVRMSVEKFLATFAPEGFIRRGAEYLSADYGRTERNLEIRLTTTFAGLEIEWTD